MGAVIASAIALCVMCRRTKLLVRLAQPGPSLEMSSFAASSHCILSVLSAVCPYPFELLQFCLLEVTSVLNFH